LLSISQNSRSIPSQAADFCSLSEKGLPMIFAVAKIEACATYVVQGRKISS
jgi:hypothetical protein